MSLPTKIGILEFRYQHSQTLRQKILEHGFCSINLEDSFNHAPFISFWKVWECLRRQL